MLDLLIVGIVLVQCMLQMSSYPPPSAHSLPPPTPTPTHIP